MELKFVEAGHPVTGSNPLGGNWGKFAVGRWQAKELREKTQFPGCEGQFITNLNGHGMNHIWLFDLQTGEGARFHTNNPIPIDTHDQLSKHQIWVCPLFEPFMVWLWALIKKFPGSWWNELPRTVELPDAPAHLYGYRRGNDYVTADGVNLGPSRLEQMRATSGGVELTDEVMEGLADEAEAGYQVDKLQPRPQPDAARTPAREFVEGPG